MRSKLSLKDSYVFYNCGKFILSNFLYKLYPSSGTELTRLLVKVFVQILRLALSQLQNYREFFNFFLIF